MSREERALYRNTIAKITSRISMEHDVTVSVTVKPNAHFRQYASVSPYYSNVLKESVRYAEGMSVMQERKLRTESMDFAGTSIRVMLISSNKITKN